MGQSTETMPPQVRTQMARRPASREPLLKECLSELPEKDRNDLDRIVESMKGILTKLRAERDRGRFNPY